MWKGVSTAAAPFVEGAGAAATPNYVGKGPTPAVAPFVAARVVLQNVNPRAARVVLCYKMTTQEQKSGNRQIV